ANHRMVPTHATKAGIRYRYYVSLPLLHGESKSASVGSVSRISAAGMEQTIIRALNEHVIAQKEKSAFGSAHVGDRKFVLEHIAPRQKCSVRQVNMTISLAFLAPDLVRAAVEGCLPRGLGVERLRDAPAEWSRQFEALGLKPG